MNANDLCIPGGEFEALHDAGLSCLSIGEQQAQEDITQQSLRNEEKFSEWTYESADKRVTIDFDHEKLSLSQLENIVQSAQHVHRIVHARGGSNMSPI